MSSDEKVDIFRDTYIRYLGYANEVGEAFRNIVHKNVVKGSYLVSGSYVLADATSKSMTEKEKDNGVPVRTFTDVVIWQGLASVIIPGFTINRICFGMGYLVKSMPVKQRSVIVTGTGLLAIPFIIKPIDHGVDVLMDKIVRPYVLNNIKV